MDTSGLSHPPELTPLDELFDWAGLDLNRLNFVARHASLDFDAVRRLILYRDLTSDVGPFEYGSIQANPRAKEHIERFFKETPMSQLITWVGRSSRRWKLLSEQVEIPYEVWCIFIKCDPSFNKIRECQCWWVLERFLAEMPLPERLEWVKHDERRLCTLISEVRLDSDLWALLLVDPSLFIHRPAKTMSKYFIPARPALINLALKNPYLPTNIRNAINAALT